MRRISTIKPMRRAAIFFILFPLFLLSIGSVQAVLPLEARVASKAAEVQKRIEVRQTDIKNRVELQREEIATRAGEVRKKLVEHRKVLIRKYFARMMLRFQAAIARMGRIADRIERRLGIMEERGIDVADLQSDLSAVRDDLSVAEGLLGGLEDKVEEALASEDPKSAFEPVRQTVQEVRDMFKDIHQQLVTIVQAMRTLATEAGVEATESALPGQQ